MKIEIKEYDEDSKEADILISDREHSFLAYWPYCNGQQPNGNYSLSAFLPTNIETTLQPLSIGKSDEGYYAYRIVGMLIERKKDVGKVQIGEIVIELRTIPGDIKIGENISFDVMRIDFRQN